MDENLNNNKVSLAEKVIGFLKNNKGKLILFLSILIIIILSIISFKIYNEKNNQSSENYILAGIILASGKKDQAIVIYDEIIKSKNGFYSILALNTILEKKLISDQEKILDYFKIIEKTTKEKEKKDLINFKKALFLIKNLKETEEKILQDLIRERSDYKLIAEEILKN